MSKLTGVLVLVFLFLTSCSDYQHVSKQQGETSLIEKITDSNSNFVKLCSDFAAHPDDPFKPKDSVGVWDDEYQAGKIDIYEAEKNCLAATESSGDQQGQSYYYLARVQALLGRQSAAEQSLAKSFELGYPTAIDQRINILLAEQELNVNEIDKLTKKLATYDNAKAIKYRQQAADAIGQSLLEKLEVGFNIDASPLVDQAKQDIERLDKESGQKFIALLREKELQTSSLNHPELFRALRDGRTDEIGDDIVTRGHILGIYGVLNTNCRGVADVVPGIEVENAAQKYEASLVGKNVDRAVTAITNFGSDGKLQNEVQSRINSMAAAQSLGDLLVEGLKIQADVNNVVQKNFANRYITSVNDINALIGKDFIACGKPAIRAIAASTFKIIEQRADSKPLEVTSIEKSAGGKVAR